MQYGHVESAPQPGARWAIQTDHAEYFDWIRTHVDPRPELGEIPYDDPTFGIIDEEAGMNYEIKYLREGRPIYRVACAEDGSQMRYALRAAHSMPERTIGSQTPPAIPLPDEGWRHVAYGKLESGAPTEAGSDPDGFPPQQPGTLRHGGSPSVMLRCDRRGRGRESESSP